MKKAQSCWLKQSKKSYCVKSVRIWSYSGPHFPAFWLNTNLYSVRMRENVDQNNSDYGQQTCTARFTRSKEYKYKSLFLCTFLIFQVSRHLRWAFSKEWDGKVVSICCYSCLREKHPNCVMASLNFNNLPKKLQVLLLIYEVTSNFIFFITNVISILWCFTLL